MSGPVGSPCLGRAARRWCLLALAAALAACSRPGPVPSPTAAPCSAQAAAFVAAAESAISAWDAAEAVARAADGDALGAAIERLTALRADLSALQPPECALPAKVAISAYMGLAIDVQNALYMNDCRLCMEETERQAAAARQAAVDALAVLQPAP